MLVVAAGVVMRGEQILICQRKAGVHNGLKWEFPGGKLEAGEAPEAALVRELREELAVDAAVTGVCDVLFHRYPDRDVLLLFYYCRIADDAAPMPLDCNNIAWLDLPKLLTLDLADADREFAERLKRHLAHKNV